MTTTDPQRAGEELALAAAGGAHAGGPVEIAHGAVAADEILVLRRGPGANCSSVGSALDILFLSATLAGAILAVTAAAFGADDMKDTDDAPPDPKEGDARAG